MSGKTYSERALSTIIDVVTQYVEDPNLRDQIIAKCHKGIGWLLTSPPEYQRADIDLSKDESYYLAAAVRRRQRAIKKQKVVQRG